METYLRAVLKLRRHLDVGLCTVIEHAHRPDVLVAAADRVIEVDLLDGEYGGRYISCMFFLLRQGLLLLRRDEQRRGHKAGHRAGTDRHPREVPGPLGGVDALPEPLSGIFERGLERILGGIRLLGEVFGLSQLGWRRVRRGLVALRLVL